MRLRKQSEFHRVQGRREIRGLSEGTRVTEHSKRPTMDRRTGLNILAGTEIFRLLPADALERLLQAAFRARLAEGEVLFRQDDPVSTFHVVVVGRLRVTQTTPEGSQVIIRYVGPGEIVGYAALSAASAYSGTVTAVDDTHLFGWTASALRRLMSEYPQISFNAVALLGARYREMQLRLRELATENVERRLAHTLLRLAGQAGRRTALGIEIAFPLARQDLAEMAGTTLHTVSRTLSAWEAQGIVSSGRRRVVLCRQQALSAIADSKPR